MLSVGTGHLSGRRDCVWEPVFGLELDGGCDAPDSKKKGLVQAAFAVTDKQPLGFFACKIRRVIDLTMGKNHRVDPIPTAHAMPIE